MKKALFHVTMLLLAFAAAPMLMAQDDEDPHHRLSPERMREIKAQKSAYLTQKMNLSPEEAQRFWPVYNQMDEELATVRHDHIQYKRSISERGDLLTEKEANEFLDRELAVREKDHAIRKKYDPQLRKAIGAQKMVLLHKAERDFHREIMRRYRERGDATRGGERGSPREGPSPRR